MVRNVSDKKIYWNGKMTFVCALALFLSSWFDKAGIYTVNYLANA